MRTYGPKLPYRLTTSGEVLDRCPDLQTAQSVAVAMLSRKATILSEIRIMLGNSIVAVVSK